MILIFTHLSLSFLHILYEKENLYKFGSSFILYFQVQEFFSHMRIAFFSEAFYYNLQESVLEKAVWFHWLFMQQKEIACMKNRASSGAKIKLAGDGQLDSPGELSPEYGLFLLKVVRLFKIGAHQANFMN